MEAFLVPRWRLTDHGRHAGETGVGAPPLREETMSLTNVGQTEEEKDAAMLPIKVFTIYRISH